MSRVGDKLPLLLVAFRHRLYDPAGQEQQQHKHPAQRCRRHPQAGKQSGLEALQAPAAVQEDDADAIVLFRHQIAVMPQKAGILPAGKHHLGVLLCRLGIHGGDVGHVRGDGAAGLVHRHPEEPGFIGCFRRKGHSAHGAVIPLLPGIVRSALHDRIHLLRESALVVGEQP